MTSPTTGFAFLDEPGVVIPFAHRGGGRTPGVVGLENTLPAFRQAVAAGYRYLETDVHTTRDGVLIAFHDPHLDRVAGTPGEIAQLRYDEIQGTRIGGTELIPTLAQLFDEFGDARFNIDLKSDTAVRALAEFVDARAAYDRVLVGSFSVRRLRAFRRLMGRSVPTSAHPLEVLPFLGAPSRLSRVVAGCQALQVPYRHRGVRVVTGGLVRRAHQIGCHVHVWTVDEPDEMHELIDLGVDGLMTDRTDILKQVLVERGLWREQP